VLVYPSDVAISGTKIATARARAAIAASLTDAPAYMTTSAEAQRIEDAIQAAAGDPNDRVASSVRDRLVRLREIDGQIARLAVPFDEWETVYRQRLQVERDLLAGAGHAAPGQASGAEREPSVAERLVALGTAALIATDAALLAADRLRSRPKR
jgi:hypothetical protein